VPKQKNNMDLSIRRALVRTYKLLMKGFSKDNDISPLNRTQAHIILFILYEGRLSMSELHRISGLEKGSLTGIIDKLIDLSFVIRTRDQLDRRKVFIELTDKGQTIAREIEKKIDNHIRKKLDILSETDIQRFKDAINTLEEISQILQAE